MHGVNGSYFIFIEIPLYHLLQMQISSSLKQL